MTPLNDGYGLRLARDVDLPAVVELEERAQQAPWSADVFSRELELDWSHIWLICLLDEPDVVVGFMVFWVVHDEVHILNVAVDPEHRRRGLARAMLLRNIEIAVQQGCVVITLEVRVSNKPAQRLYTGLGFAVIGERKRYYIDNDEDAYVMARIIEES